MRVWVCWRHEDYRIERFGDDWSELHCNYGVTVRTSEGGVYVKPCNEPMTPDD